MNRSTRKAAPKTESQKTPKKATTSKAALKKASAASVAPDIHALEQEIDRKLQLLQSPPKDIAESENDLDETEVETPDAPVISTAYREFEEVFARWKTTDDPELGEALRHQLILMYRNLVVSLARRFLERGEMFDDLVQQGIIGLIYALDHFDPARGVRFTTFATPAILGEIRRYFRDKSWCIRVPRRMQELHQSINRRMDQLTQQYNRAPTYAEIANALNLSEEDVIEVIEMSHSVDPMSLDEQTPNETGNSQATLGETLGETDLELQKRHDWAPLRDALNTLPERQRRVMEGIYFQGRSQVEIARDLNVSQMYVSRAQRRALAKLKEILHESDV